MAIFSNVYVSRNIEYFPDCACILEYWVFSRMCMYLGILAVCQNTCFTDMRYNLDDLPGAMDDWDWWWEKKSGSSMLSAWLEDWDIYIHQNMFRGLINMKYLIRLFPFIFYVYELMHGLNKICLHIEEWTCQYKCLYICRMCLHIHTCCCSNIFAQFFF